MIDVKNTCQQIWILCFQQANTQYELDLYAWNYDNNYFVYPGRVCFEKYLS